MNATELTPLEIAAGVVVGEDPTSPPLPRNVGGAPRAHFEDALLPMLQRQPCCVTFSGGRDSSAVLAVAVHVARREGLPEPIPITLRYPDVPEADEDEWQEMVIRHLGVTEWEHIEITDELDFLGPTATDLLSRHGLIWPPNTQTQVPPARIARGGSILTGWEGDGLFGAWRRTELGDILAGRRRARPRDVLRFGYAYGPPALRRARMKRREMVSHPWMTEQADREFALAWIRGNAEEPATWAARVRWWARRRYVGMVCRALEKVGADHDVLFGHPLTDRRFVASLADLGGVAGLGDRTRIMDLLFGDLLPREVIARRTKATFAVPFWGPATREFTSRWGGDGVDTSIVDVDGLKETWSQPVPDTRTATLVHSVWLRTSGDRVEQSNGDR